jgi:hypothetical protein
MVPRPPARADGRSQIALTILGEEVDRSMGGRPCILQGIRASMRGPGVGRPFRFRRRTAKARRAPWCKVRMPEIVSLRARAAVGLLGVVIFPVATALHPSHADAWLYTGFAVPAMNLSLGSGTALLVGIAAIAVLMWRRGGKALSAFSGTPLGSERDPCTSAPRSRSSCLDPWEQRRRPDHQKRW